MATPEREPGLTDTDILIDASRGVRDAVVLPLYTKNVKHFGMIPSLSVVPPY